MNKSKKLGEALALCGVALSILKELEENERSELKLLFKALDITDADFEKIEDAKLYGIALDLDSHAYSLKNQAEDLETVMQDIERLKL